MAIGMHSSKCVIVDHKATFQKVTTNVSGQLSVLHLVLRCLEMGRNLVWWCIVVFIGCFGSPIYHTYQTIIIREKIDTSVQGRVFFFAGNDHAGSNSLGFLGGGMLADYVFEPFMKKMYSETKHNNFFWLAGKTAPE